MAWWKKVEVGDYGSVTGWLKMKSIYRKVNPGDYGEIKTSGGQSTGWMKIRSIWRYEGSGNWRRVFGIALPYPKVDPQLIFVSPDSSTSEYYCTQQDKMYVTRGKWYEDPISFLIKIQKAAITNMISPTELISQ